MGHRLRRTKNIVAECVYPLLRLVCCRLATDTRRYSQYVYHLVSSRDTPATVPLRASSLRRQGRNTAERRAIITVVYACMNSEVERLVNIFFVPRGSIRPCSARSPGDDRGSRTPASCVPSTAGKTPHRTVQSPHSGKEQTGGFSSRCLSSP